MAERKNRSLYIYKSSMEIYFYMPVPNETQRRVGFDSVLCHVYMVLKLLDWNYYMNIYFIEET